MTQLDPAKIWHLDEKKLLKIIGRGSFVPNPKVVHFYVPSFIHYNTRYYKTSKTSFPTISITGKECSLSCKHCSGKILSSMNPIKTPEKLFKFASRLKRKSAEGFLLSGGCKSDGSIPLSDFIPVLRRIKRELGLLVFVHTGIIGTCAALELKEAGIDAALIDIIGSNETIRKICNSSLTVNDYANSLSALDKSGLSFVPHVIVGLDQGRLKGELQALKIISKVNPDAIVIIAFMPLRGTAMSGVDPPRSIDLARVMLSARLMFPKVPLVLGCMRSKRKHRSRTEILALKAGANGVAFPSEETIKYCKAKKYDLRFLSHCCASIFLETASLKFSK